MNADLPLWLVPRVAPSWSWDEIEPLPLLRTEDGSLPEQPTRVRLAWNDEAFFIRFDCEDRDAWGTYRRRDEPLYEEEVVEVFLAPGDEDPKRYFEFEVSPLSTLFDAVIHNPTGRRAEMIIDTSWDCSGIVWKAGRAGERDDWWAELALPWAALGGSPEAIPRWRANFYRIDRPRVPGASGPVPGTASEYTAASPTLVRPAEFHRPERFGRLELAGAGRIR